MLAKQLSSVIETSPIRPENELATGYYGLQLTTKINDSDRYETCRWQYGAMAPVDICTVTFPCVNGTEGNFNCADLRSNRQEIISSLIVQFSVPTLVVVRVECADSDWRIL